MDFKIRNIEKHDKDYIVDMMRRFYASPAVNSNGSEEIFENDVNMCIEDNSYLEGFVVENESEIIGYTMIAKSFSTEFGKMCIWIEDLYLKDNYRKMGIGKKIMEFISNNYKDCIFKLEVEKENQNAFKLYKKNGFEILPYLEMIKF